MESQHKQPNKLVQKKLTFTKPLQKKTNVINVKVKFLRQMGYQNFQQWVKDPNNVYIGRNMSHYVPGAKASKWANMFKVQQYGRDGCIQKYKEYILSNKQLISQLSNLKGKTLGCWCKPQACHGDVLVELAQKWQTFSNQKQEKKG